MKDKFDEDGYIVPSGRIPHDEEDGWFAVPQESIPIHAGIRTTCTPHIPTHKPAPTEELHSRCRLPYVKSSFSTKMIAFVNIKLGKVDGIPTARATVVQKKMTTLLKSGTQKPFYKNVLTVDYNIADPHEWRGTNGKLGKLTFHMLTVIKAEFEKRTKCRMCEKGSVWHKKGNNGSYLMQWYQPHDLNDDHLCGQCQNWLHPTKNNFNPKPDLDDDDQPYNNIFADCVNEIMVDSREKLLDNIDFIVARDMQETRKFMGTGDKECVDWELQNQWALVYKYKLFDELDIDKYLNGG